MDAARELATAATSLDPFVDTNWQKRLKQRNKTVDDLVHNIKLITNEFLFIVQITWAAVAVSTAFSWATPSSLNATLHWASAC